MNPMMKPGPMGIGPKPMGTMGPMDLGPPPGPQAGPGGGEPPNLRDADDEAMSCGACMHFSPEGCGKFGSYPVDETQVCDAFEPMGAAEGGGAPPPMPMPEEMA